MSVYVWSNFGNVCTCRKSLGSCEKCASGQNFGSRERVNVWTEFKIL